MNALTITLISIFSVIFGILLISSICSYIGYKAIWNARTYEINDPVKIQFEDIEEWTTRIPLSFKIKKKLPDFDKEVRGFIYSPKDNSIKKKPIVIMSAGYGRTHLSYLLDIGILTKDGFEVFAFDQFGTGMSGGSKQRGIHFGRITLDSVLNSIKESKVFEGRPIYLYGHSWGGYSVLSVLGKHKEISKVIARSPAGKPVLSTYVLGQSMLGNFLTSFLYIVGIPMIFLFQGPYAFVSAANQVKKNKNTKILITSCKEDPTVLTIASPIPKLIKNSQENVEFYIRNDLNIHNDLLTKEGYDYFKEKQAEYNSIMNTIDSSYEERMNDFLSALDRTKITSDSNEKEKILNFLNK